MGQGGAGAKGEQVYFCIYNNRKDAGVVVNIFNPSTQKTADRWVPGLPNLQNEFLDFIEKPYLKEKQQIIGKKTALWEK